jgi:hypothetical protein
MAFVQIIEFRTSNIEPARQINEHWRQATDGSAPSANCSPAITQIQPLLRHRVLRVLRVGGGELQRAGNQGRRSTAHAGRRGRAGVYNLDILEDRAQAAAFGTVAFVLPPIPYTVKRVRCLPRKTQKGD